MTWCRAKPRVILPNLWPINARWAKNTLRDTMSVAMNCGKLQQQQIWAGARVFSACIICARGIKNAASFVFWSVGHAILRKKGTTVKKGHQGSAYYAESFFNTLMFQLLLWCIEEDSECHSIPAASKSSKLQPAAAGAKVFYGGS